MKKNLFTGIFWFILVVLVVYAIGGKTTVAKKPVVKNPVVKTIAVKNPVVKTSEDSETKTASEGAQIYATKSFALVFDDNGELFMSIPKRTIVLLNSRTENGKFYNISFISHGMMISGWVLSEYIGTYSGPPMLR